VALGSRSHKCERREWFIDTTLELNALERVVGKVQTPAVWRGDEKRGSGRPVESTHAYVGELLPSVLKYRPVSAKGGRAVHDSSPLVHPSTVLTVLDLTWR